MLKRPLALFLFLFIMGEVIVRLLLSNLLWIIPITLLTGVIIRRGRKYMTGEIRVVYFLLFFGLLLGSGHGALYYYLRFKEVSGLKHLLNEEIKCEGEVLSIKEGDGYKSYVIKVKEGKVVFFEKDLDGKISYGNILDGEILDGEILDGEILDGEILDGEILDGMRRDVLENCITGSGPLPGDIILIKGHLNEIKKASNPGSFDRNAYYKSKGIDYFVSGEIVGIKRKNSIKKSLYIIKNTMKQALYSVLPEKEAGLLSSMLLGDKEGIDRKDYIIYQMNGMAHMLAISGLHVSLVAEAFFFFFMLLLRRRRGAAVLTIVIILLYGSITGFAEATSRAVIMMIVIMAGRVFSSAADTLTSLSIALFINVIINPYSILSSGFIMSYLAVAGVLISQVFYKLIFKNERFLMVPLKFRKYLIYFIKTLLMGIILNAIMLPVILNNYFGIPVFSFLINMFLVPLLSIALIFGFAAGGVYLLLIKISRIRKICIILALPARWVLNLYETVGKFVIKLPGSYITTGHIGTTGVIIICLIFFIITAFIYHSLRHSALRKKPGKIENSKRRKYVLTLSIYIFMMMISVGTVKIINQCRELVLFLDVGQGDCCIVHTRNGGNYIFDSGSTTVRDVGYRTLIPALKYYGIDKIDVIFVSHTDEDHINGIIELINLSDIEKIKIKNIAFAKGTAEDENMNAVLSWIDKKEAKGDRGTNVLYLNAGDVISKGGLSISILYPSVEETDENSGNDYSLVADLRYKNLEVYFTGDISSMVEEKLVNLIIGKKEKSKAGVRILKVPHHGSKYSSSEAFLKKVDCDIAVISVGENNFYGHPHKEALERLEEAGCKIYRTDMAGGITIYID